MKRKEKRFLFVGVVFILLFIIWTAMIKNIDVQPVGPQMTYVGFAKFNSWFHDLTGVHMELYTLTDWLGIVPVAVCLIFGTFGFSQMIGRKSLFKVDKDIILLGIYYVIVIMGYLIFEIIPINYRPIAINGIIEVSYPSSTTLLVLSVMPTMIFQTNLRLKNSFMKGAIQGCVILFMTFMVTGRLISGVHWFTDIVGGVFLSAGLFHIYKGMVLMSIKGHR
ncbi:MAG: phosphatase PAP2 family protein [Eubacterium sp.]|nr:phosphatase PAP2 family protein [Eubacterium sp.]